ncbi:MAG: efflux RND transporter permease subunit [Fibrobacter sp.]|nr:efflux RND transporter permease subunit [Fibrobacter sp.]
MIRTSIYRPILMLMILTTFVVFGIYTFRLTPVAMMPEFDIPYVTIQLIYPGAGPREIENSVLEEIEEQLELLDGIDEVISFAFESFAIVVLKFQMGLDINVAANDAKEKLDQLRKDLPLDLEDPIISKLDITNMPILSLALTGDINASELRIIADDDIKPALSQVMGVASVDIIGGLEREILVKLHKNNLEARDLTAEQVVGTIMGSNLNFPLGNVRTERQEMNLRYNAEFESIEELAALEMPTATGIVRLSDIATISDTFKDVTQVARYNQQTSVGLDIKKRSDANIIETVRALRRAIPEIEKTLPEGLQLHIAYDNSEHIENSVNDVYQNIGIGIFFTAAVLLLFLRNLRTTIIAAISMPVSVISTFTFMYASGFTLNMVSLMALGISVGLLVTNSIVVLENIITHLRHDGGAKRAAEKGTNQVMVAVMASTLTNVAVFIPIAFMSSMVGKVFKEFGLTMAYATFVSLLISFTLIPMMAAYIIKTKKEDLIEEEEKGVFIKFRNLYEKLLEFSLSAKGAVVLIAIVGSLLASLAVVGPLLGSEFVPKSDEGFFDVTIELSDATRIHITEEVAIEIENRVKKIPEVESIYTTVGSGGRMSSIGGANAARLAVKLVPKKDRNRSTDEIILELRPLLADIPDAEIRIKASNSTTGGGGQADLDVQILGSNLDSLSVADSILQAITGQVPGVIDVYSDWTAGKPEMVMRPKRSAIADFGLVPAQVAGVLRSLVHGTESGMLRAYDEETDIFVKLDESDYFAREDLLSINVQTPRGPTPISNLVEQTQESGPSQIARKRGLRMVTVSSNVLPGFTAGEVQSHIVKELESTQLPGDCYVHFGGDAEMMADAFLDFTVAIIMAIILTYILLTAILESFWQPVLIMMTLPLGLIGVIWSLFVTGKAISIVSLMAMVMLVGVVVNNAILILDESNQIRRNTNADMRTSLIQAGRNKLRAIIMTNIAAICSMLPLALGLGDGAEFRQPMAIATIGGLIVSTTFTVFLIPTLVWIPGGIINYFKAKKT